MYLCRKFNYAYKHLSNMCAYVMNLRSIKAVEAEFHTYSNIVEQFLESGGGLICLTGKCPLVDDIWTYVVSIFDT